MIVRAEVIADSYADSVRLLEATRAMGEADDIGWASAMMATPANLEVLAAEGFADDLEGAQANDLVLAVKGAHADAADRALDAGRHILFAAASGPVADSGPGRAASLDEALAAAPGANAAIVSVPGPYAALEAHKALTRGLDVMLFSDNVPLEDEIALKTRARSLGRLVMGPGAGTAVLAGTGLGFSNRVAAGPVGVVAAAGTGAQEVMTLLDRWGSGVSHVIGVGGRDLSAAVGGLMAEAAMEAFDRHDATAAILLVSKPPAAAGAERLLGARRTKPVVAALIGLDEPLAAAGAGAGLTVCSTLEQGVVATLAVLGHPRPDPIGSTDADVARLITGLDPRRQRMVGLFSGGTLAYETMTIARRHIGPICSNTPLEPDWTLPGPEGAHICLDLGEEEYTRGRPHPMIDPEARLELLARQASDPTVAAVVMDVVIGDGAHPDPAGVLAPVAAEVAASGPAVIAYVLGTGRDPQGFAGQRRILREAGCVVPETAARAALAAAAVVNRDPALVHDDLGAGPTS